MIRSGQSICSIACPKGCGQSRSFRHQTAAVLLAVTVFALQSGVAVAAPAEPDALRSGFVDPPNSARPRVWWHWMNGNITLDGLIKDLDWMKRVGIGGAQAFDANLLTPQIVEHRLVYMTPEWKSVFRAAASHADQLGLELGIASSPGWSETGGPWVPPADGLKKVVWSETRLTGGRPYQGKLPPPPTTTGPWQTIPMTPDAADLMNPKARTAPQAAHGDIAVLAYPASPDERRAPRILSATGAVIDGAALFDDDPQSALLVTGSIAFDYGSPTTLRAATLFAPGAVPPLGSARIAPRLEASDDGATWRPVATFHVGDIPATVSFAPQTARMFRLVIAGLDGKADPAAPPSARIGMLHLATRPMVDQAQAKAGFAVAQNYFALATSADPGDPGLAPDAVIDITSHMRPDGTLDWTPPEGEWHVLRLGWSLIGTRNHPATPEATGLEVDKFDGAAVRRYLETYLGMYRDATDPELIGHHGVRALVTDSIEVGPANWTPRLIERFRALRGYDPTPWLPALTGVLVGTRTDSDKFLFDYRRTLADLIASEHYGTVATVAHENGLIVYGEALEDHRPSLGDDMAMRSHTDVPMAAMWMFPPASGPKPTYLADIKGAASVAHIYGQNIVAAESMTSSRKFWAFGPADLRPVIDLEFATGVNRPVIHTSVHQPLDKAPGVSLYHFGQFFNRLESWGEMARPWVDYIARSSFMLQQGRNIADVAYFYGEEAPLTGLYGDSPVADAPTRHAYDFANSDVVAHQLRVDRGDLVAPGGARYRLLYLGGSSRHMTLPILRRIAQFAEQGATIVGDAPLGSPGLDGDAAEYRALCERLWTGAPTTRVGAGQVIAGHDVEAALAAIGSAPDFSYTALPDTRLLFVHRRSDDGDIYFVDNRRDRPEHVEARFRVTGKAPEIWHADTGRSEPVSYRIVDGATVVPLDLDSEQSLFVVFRTSATASTRVVDHASYTQVATLDGPWQVAFQAGRGAPATTTLAKLYSLSHHSDPGIRYFSGVATYSQSFDLPAGIRLGSPVRLDLGLVGVMAEVRVNGIPVGTAWHAPFRLDIGRALRRGRNRLDIRVADLWVNRLIGDAQPGAKPIAFTTIPTYGASAPLRPSGLIGPVTMDVALPTR